MIRYIRLPQPIAPFPSPALFSAFACGCTIIITTPSLTISRFANCKNISHSLCPGVGASSTVLPLTVRFQYIKVSPSERSFDRVSAMLLKSFAHRRAGVSARAANRQAPVLPPSHCTVDAGSPQLQAQLSRRNALALLSAAPFVIQGPAEAVQGLTAGRIPGLGTVADENGFFEYVRPEGKSGGHGVGWSEIPRYAFKVPAGWAEIPVSIADLGGTEIDLRYSSKEQGELAVVVAPVLRFADIGFNAKVHIEDIGSPEKVIKGFGPELFGKPIDDEDILDIKVKTVGPLTYYNVAVKPHSLVSATATGNRMFIMSLRANSQQWRKHSEDLLAIQDTFFVPGV